MLEDAYPGKQIAWRKSLEKAQLGKTTGAAGETHTLGGTRFAHRDGDTIYMYWYID